jgi:hypothetical protein
MNYPQIHLFIDPSSLFASDEKLAELNPHGKLVTLLLKDDDPTEWKMAVRSILSIRQYRKDWRHAPQEKHVLIEGGLSTTFLLALSNDIHDVLYIASERELQEAEDLYSLITTYQNFGEDLNNLRQSHDELLGSILELTDETSLTHTVSEDLLCSSIDPDWQSNLNQAVKDLINAFVDRGKEQMHSAFIETTKRAA